MERTSKRVGLPFASVVAAIAWIAACGGGSNGSGAGGGPGGDAGAGADGSGGAGDGGAITPTNPDDGPPAGNPNGHCTVPAEAQAEDVSNPRTVVGDGTKASCTSDAFVAAVAKGGVITFNCGSDPTTIVVTQTAKIYNDTGPKVVIDGGGKITLSGGGTTRILYQNSCDASLHGGANCNDTQVPALTVQNITFVDASSKGIPDTDNGAGGGAIWVRGGRFKIVNARFFNNVCDDLGSDLGGGAVRVLDFPSQGTSQTRPVYIVNSTFGGKAGFGNHCANGGAISSIGASYTILNTLITDSDAVGHGANSGQGGNGGGIYNDGNTYTLSLCGVDMENNHANEGGGAIFYVSNDKTGTLVISDSTLKHNRSDGFETQGYPGIFVQASGPPQVTNSTLQ